MRAGDRERRGGKQWAEIHTESKFGGGFRGCKGGAECVGGGGGRATGDDGDGLRLRLAGAAETDGEPDEEEGHEHTDDGDGGGDVGDVRVGRRRDGRGRRGGGVCEGHEEGVKKRVACLKRLLPVEAIPFQY